MSKFKMKIALNGDVTAQEVDFDKVFTPEFMQKYSKYQSIEDFFGGVNVTNQVELEETSDQAMDEFVVANTDFKSWQELLDTATTEHIKRQFGI